MMPSEFGVKLCKKKNLLTRTNTCKSVSHMCCCRTYNYSLHTLLCCTTMTILFQMWLYLNFFWKIFLLGIIFFPDVLRMIVHCESPKNRVFPSKIKCWIWTLYKVHIAHQCWTIFAIKLPYCFIAFIQQGATHFHIRAWHYYCSF